MTKYGMAIDTKCCTGCNMCSMACRVDHNLPTEVLYSRAHTEGGDTFRQAGGTYPDQVTLKFYTLACQHCDEPACVEICPTGASQKREEDGLVLVDGVEHLPGGFFHQQAGPRLHRQALRPGRDRQNGQRRQGQQAGNDLFHTIFLPFS